MNKLFTAKVNQIKQNQQRSAFIFSFRTGLLTVEGSNQKNILVKKCF